MNICCDNCEPMNDICAYSCPIYSNPNSSINDKCFIKNNNNNNNINKMNYSLDELNLIDLNMKVDLLNSKVNQINNAFSQINLNYLEKKKDD